MRTAPRQARSALKPLLTAITASLVFAAVGAGQGEAGAPVAVTATSLGTDALYPGGAAAGYTVTFGLAAGTNVAYVPTLHPVVSVVGASGRCEPGWFSAPDIPVDEQVHRGDTANGRISFVNRNVDQAGCSGAEIDVTFTQRQRHASAPTTPPVP